LHFVADFFGFAEDAEQVAAQNLADIVGAVAAVEQGLCDFGRSAAESMPAGVAPLTPSKSEPRPTWSMPATLAMWSM